jgi:hypothetical protein
MTNTVIKQFFDEQETKIMEFTYFVTPETSLEDAILTLIKLYPKIDAGQIQELLKRRYHKWEVGQELENMIFWNKIKEENPIRPREGLRIVTKVA